MKTCDTKTDIVILGAGIGGYEAFRMLSRLLRIHRIHKKITLIDKHNHFTFVPMMHEVATGSILPTHAAVPLRELVYKTAHQFIKATITSIDPEKKTVATGSGTISYDYCIVALGSETNFFQTPGTKEYCHDVRNLFSALSLQQDFIKKLDECNDAEDFCITIVGGGYTGVEVAGQFCDLAQKEIKKLYPHKKIRIQIIHAGEKLMQYSPKKIQTIVEKKLKKENVKIIYNARAVKITQTEVVLADGYKIPSNLTVWTAGFKNLGPCFLKEKYCDKSGRIPVNKFLQHTSFDSLYAIGDIALFCNEGQTTPAPQLAEAAHKQGMYAARHIVHQLRNKKTHRPFHFKQYGSLMPIGDWFGIAQIGPFIFSGKFAWWLRRTVYVLYMPGFIRKVRIVFDWTIHSFGMRNIVNIEDGESKDYRYPHGTAREKNV